jgi:hypothetical protein
MIQRLHEGLGVSTDLLVQPARLTRDTMGVSQDQARDRGKVRMGSSRITAGFPPLRQRKPEPRDPFGAMRLGSAATAPPRF